MSREGVRDIFMVNSTPVGYSIPSLLFTCNEVIVNPCRGNIVMLIIFYPFALSWFAIIVAIPKGPMARGTSG
jgi:hypothetical protein